MIDIYFTESMKQYDATYAVNNKITRNHKWVTINGNLQSCVGW